MSSAPLLGNEKAGPVEPPFTFADLDTRKEDLAKGLTEAEVKARLDKYGYNEVPEHKEPLWKMFVKQFTGPMQIMIECAAALCLSIQNWPDFTIIMVLLMTNGTLGFFEEKSAQASVDALKAGLERKMPVKRITADGKANFEGLAVKNMVPGDIVFMRGGDIIPADCYYLSGDPCQVDEAALTGESLPVKVPRNNEKEQDGKDKPYTGKRLWSGSILKVGECEAIVSHSGVNTMIGEAAVAIQEAGGKDVGVFEGKIIMAAKILILTTAVVVIVLFCYMTFKEKVPLAEVLEMSLSMVIASVPVALPMVMKVTLSIGAKEMADHGGIVTHLTALEEIASMKVLCSDKTGTLTTASMTVYCDHQARVFNNFTAAQVCEFASMASNEANKDDPIDSAVLRAYKDSVGAQSIDEAVEQRKTKFKLQPDGFCGFNAIVKRTSATVKNTTDGKTYFVAKGMVDVILKTDPADEGKYQWKVDNFETMQREVLAADAALGTSGFKTLGVCVSINGGPHVFAGILPIMDPPRHDTKKTIANIKGCNVSVKMITGDHFNIGKELARQIDLGTDIRTPESLKAQGGKPLGKKEKEDIILHADGFAKVKPLDKHDVVSTLQNVGMVVGMTGDGVNDAPALAKAQIGIAVHGATDAAKAAGDIVLTQDGLSPIYTAIQISRRIFKRLKSYVIYRICITVQVVFFLAAIALGYNLRFKALYIILLALFHDLQIVTIAYDHQVESKFPETPTVVGLLAQSWTMGVLMFVQTLLLITCGRDYMSTEFQDSYDITFGSDKMREMDQYLETAVFLQISNSSAILIFSARTLFFFFMSVPAKQLLFSTILGQVIVNGWILFAGGDCHGNGPAPAPPALFLDAATTTVAATTAAPGPTVLICKMSHEDVGKVWAYDFMWLLILDLVKMGVNQIWEKFKPKDLDFNPALVHKQDEERRSRRQSNCLKGAKGGGLVADVHKDAIRKSGRMSVSGQTQGN